MTRLARGSPSWVVTSDWTGVNVRCCDSVQSYAARGDHTAPPPLSSPGRGCKANALALERTF